MPKQIASKFYDTEAGTITYKYIDGSVVTAPGDLWTELTTQDLCVGIDALTDGLEDMTEKRKAEGRCLHCGELRAMTMWGLKDCEVCLP